MNEILNEKKTIREIGKEAVDGALSLQRNLMSKEKYFARHCRMGIHMSMEAMTTSPVESMNDLIKNGEKGVTSNMNLSRSVATTTDVINERIADYKNEKYRDLDKVNLASQASTRNHVSRKAQYLIDISFDGKEYVKCAQLEEEKWVCWDFGKQKPVSQKKKKWQILWNRLPIYHDIFYVTVKRIGDNAFLHCSCCHFQE